MEVCEQLGFDDEAAVYRKLLDDCSKSGIVAPERHLVRTKAKESLLTTA